MIKFFIAIINVQPKWLKRALGALIGAFTWQLVPKRRKLTARENIMKTLSLSEKEADAVAKKSWTRFGPMLIEVMNFPNIKKHFDDYVVIEGRENLDKAMAYGKGVVLATAHTGNWELLGATMGVLNYPIIAVAQKQASGSMNRLINEYRAMMGMHVTEKTSVLEMIKYLGRGSIIGLLMDQDARDDGVILDFLGQKAACFQGPAYMARLKGAPIVPAFITKIGEGRHKVIFHAPFFVEKTTDKKEDIKRTMIKVVSFVENHIRSHPEEWFWMHDRWKYCKRPEVRRQIEEMEKLEKNRKS